MSLDDKEHHCHVNGEGEGWFCLVPTLKTGVFEGQRVADPPQTVDSVIVFPEEFEDLFGLDLRTFTPFWNAESLASQAVIGVKEGVKRVQKGYHPVRVVKAEVPC